MPLVLDLLRHGEAAPAAAGGDAARPLADAGIAHLRQLGAHLAREEWRYDRVCSSPLVRARQSAAILVAALGGSPPIEEMVELVPGAEPDDLVLALAARGARGRVLLVGHQPLLGDFMGHLSGAAPTAFPPAQLVRLMLDGPPARGAGRVVLTLDPQALAP